MTELHESDASLLTKKQRALLTAASDMDQAIAAVDALQRTHDPAEFMLMRALETAIAVCYARAFTKSKLVRLSLQKYEPSDPPLAQIHNDLYKLRDELHAHNDKKEDLRMASVVLVSVDESRFPGSVTVNFLRDEQWAAINRPVLPDVRRLCELQRDRFHDEAGKIEVYLQGPDLLRPQD